MSQHATVHTTSGDTGVLYNFNTPSWILSGFTQNPLLVTSTLGSTQLHLKGELLFSSALMELVSIEACCENIQCMGLWHQDYDQLCTYTVSHNANGSHTWFCR